MKHKQIIPRVLLLSTGFIVMIISGTIATPSLFYISFTSGFIIALRSYF